MSKNIISTEKKNNDKNLFKIDSKKNKCNSPQMSSKKSNYPTIKDINNYWKNDPPEGRERPVSFTKNFKKIKLSNDKRCAYTLWLSKDEYIRSILNKERLVSIKYLRDPYIIPDNRDFGENYYCGNRSRVNIKTISNPVK
tara:strand:+ start:78 stop:497 length:420 start_codon:yes stop_codon:yes gene_type:complete